MLYSQKLHLGVVNLVRNRGTNLATSSACQAEVARLVKLFCDEFLNEALESRHCQDCSLLARQMDSFRRLVKVYGNVAAIACKLGVAHTTVGSWKKKLESGKTLSFGVEAQLRELSPAKEWSKELLFGFDGAMYALPGLIAIHRCRTLGHLNINVRQFSASGEMANSLSSGNIHLAVMSKTMWDQVATEGAGTTPVIALVDVGAAPIQGMSGKKIEHIEDFNDMKVYFPVGTVVHTRIDELFETFLIRPKLLKSLASKDAKIFLSRDKQGTAIIGPPLWVNECLAEVPAGSFHEIRSSFLPPTPATLAYHKDCPRAPLRLFLMSLGEVLPEVRSFLKLEDWDLGGEEVNEGMRQLVDRAREEDKKNNLGKFRRDANFFSLVSLWNAEIQTLGRALSGSR